MKKYWGIGMLFGLLMLLVGCGQQEQETSSTEKSEETTKISIMASGDMLFHDGLIQSVRTADGYDFNPSFAEVTPLIQSADLAIGDFEGAINPQAAPIGYPQFNTPSAVVPAISAASYDVITLAQNHILDQGLDNALLTKQLFEEEGLTTIGLKSAKDDPIVIKDVNGIKVALLAYTYGFNDYDQELTADEYETHLLDLNREQIFADLATAEEEADVTVVLPHMGTEYQTTPNEEQEALFHEMIDHGADIIFGGHPHVPQPTEVVEHDGEQKFILYSMGNLLSNMTLESMGDIWTERGVVMEVNVEKTGDNPAKIASIQPHPTWVYRDTQADGSDIVKTAVAEEYLPGGKRENTLSPALEQRAQTAYHEVMELLAVDKNIMKEK